MIFEDDDFHPVRQDAIDELRLRRARCGGGGRRRFRCARRLLRRSGLPYGSGEQRPDERES
jgi:hypothetical protein